jgi:outer membrane protein OmpA-like peptidoglycan-associated protein
VSSPSTEYDQLRELLLAPESSSLRALADDLEAIRRQLHDPSELAQLIQPLLADAAGREDAPLRGALLNALVPVLERAICENTRINASTLATALAPTSTQAIARYYSEAPDQASADLAPLVSSAIKETVRGERDAMIDALYPVIGSTISKYVSETLASLVRQMNERIESRLSVRALTRKIRARVTGVSEGELLLRESVPVHVDAAFLIHAGSGLVMAQAQAPEIPLLDPDLLSGMLTAIRSLFNDSMNTPGRPQELDQISYGESTIILEVAGYCYLAAVVRGVPDDGIRARVRTTMAEIIQIKGFSPEAISGDSGSIPLEVVNHLRSIVEQPSPAVAVPRRKAPAGVLWVASIVLLAALIPAGIWICRNSADRDLETRLRAAIVRAFPGPSRNVALSVERGHVLLEGTAENAYRRSGITDFVTSLSQGVPVSNGIELPPPPPFPELTGAQAEAIASTLNKIPGVCIESVYREGALTLTGQTPDAQTALRIVEAFASLPGLREITSRLQPGMTAVADRILFSHASAELSADARTTVSSLHALMERAPWIRVQIAGHSDSVGDSEIQERISLLRAQAVEAALVARGIAPGRIVSVGAGASPAGSEMQIADSLNRCVVFTLIPLSSGSTP